MIFSTILYKLYKLYKPYKLKSHKRFYANHKIPFMFLHKNFDFLCKS